MAMLALLAAWLLTGVVLGGVGRLLTPPDGAGLPGWVRSWVGFAAIVAGAQAWHLVRPVDGLFLGLCLIAGLAGWLVRRPKAGAFAGTGRIELAVFLLVAVWLSNAALAPPWHPDTGLYLQQSVRWTSDYAATPGIANLNHRLGFHHAYAGWIAIFEHLEPWKRGAHAANGPVLLLAFWPALTATGRLLRGRFEAADVVGALVLARLGEDLVGTRLSSPTADLAVLCYGSLFAMWTAQLVFRKAPPSVSEMGAAVFLALLGPVLKPSVAPLVGPFALVLGWLFLRARPSFRALRQVAIAATLVVALVIVPWLVRGAILSGYPLYPSTVIDPGLSWAVPREVADEEQAYIRAWGRLPGRPIEESQTGTYWLERWLWHASLDNRGVLGPVVLTMMLFLGAALLRVRGRRGPEGAGVFGVATLAGLGAWFWLSPDVRHAGALFWLLAAAPLVFVLSATSRRMLAVRVVGGGAVAVVASAAIVSESLVILDAGRFGAFPTTIVKLTHVLRTGETLPVAGGCVETLCADLRASRLLVDPGSAPGPESRTRVVVHPVSVRLRRSGDVSAGFAPDPERARSVSTDALH